MDEGPPYINFIVLLALMCLNGFFSMSEMALVSSRKARLKAKADAGKAGYKKALEAAERPGRYLSAVQIGITLIGILSGAFGSASFQKPLEALLGNLPFIGAYAEGLSLALVVMAITMLSIILGELTPKQFALTRPESIAAVTVPVLEVIAIVFRPLVSFFSRTTSFILKLLKVAEHQDQAITEEEIRGVLKEGERYGVVEAQERTMVEGVFYLGDRPVEAFMTHRSDLSWLELEADAEEVRAAALKAKRPGVFPVARGSLDDVVGVVSAQDLLGALLDGSYAGLEPLMRKPSFVPGSMSSLKAFAVFKNDGSDLLLVMDEYGGLAGALAIRDLVEEIVGELSKPNPETEEVVRREDGSYLMDGMLNIDDFAELFGVGELLGEHREYHTVAGFVLDILGVIPRTGDFLTWHGYRIEVVDMDGNRIDKVLVAPPAPAEADGTEGGRS